MIVKTTEEQLCNLDLNPTDEGVEITQNLAALAITPIGGIPLEIEMGLPMNYKDRPMLAASIAFESEFRQAVDDYESRVQVKNVTAEIDDTGGRIIPIVEVARNAE